MVFVAESITYSIAVNILGEDRRKVYYSEILKGGGGGLLL